MKIDACLSTIRRQMKAVLYHFRAYVSLNKQFVKKIKNQLVLPRIRLFKQITIFLHVAAQLSNSRNKTNPKFGCTFAS